MSHDPSDDALLALARASARPQPSSADSARLGRAVEAVLDDEDRARRRGVSPAFVVVAVLCAGAASAGTALLLSTPTKAPPAPVTTSTTAPTRAPAATTTTTVIAPPPPAAIDDVVVAPKTKKKAAPKPETTATTTTATPPTWQEQADALQQRGELKAAAAVAAAALTGNDDPRAAGVILWGLAGRDPAVIDALDDVLMGFDGDDDALARVLRLGCELRLRHRRDAGAVAACRAFGQRFPGQPAARALAFGAGGLAEELGDLDGAIDEYTRAIVLAPLAGDGGADALFARARVRTRKGDLDEARADLRVYLQRDRRPAATHNDEVQGLARALRVELP